MNIFKTVVCCLLILGHQQQLICQNSWWDSLTSPFTSPFKIAYEWATRNTQNTVMTIGTITCIAAGCYVYQKLVQDLEQERQQEQQEAEQNNDDQTLPREIKKYTVTTLTKDNANQILEDVNTKMNTLEQEANTKMNTLMNALSF